MTFRHLCQGGTSHDAVGGGLGGSLQSLPQLFILMQYQIMAHRVKVMVLKAENLPGTAAQGREKVFSVCLCPSLSPLISISSFLSLLSFSILFLCVSNPSYGRSFLHLVTCCECVTVNTPALEAGHVIQPTNGSLWGARPGTLSESSWRADPSPGWRGWCRGGVSPHVCS